MTDKFNKVVYVCMGIIISASLMFMSCAGPSKPVHPITPGIDHTNKDLHAATETVKGTTAKITDHATKGLDATPQAARVVLEPHWREILIQAGIQEVVIKDLERAQADLSDASAKATALEKAYAKEQELRKKAESNVTKELREKYTWISIACFAVLIVSVTAAISGLGGGNFSKIAIAAAVASGIGLAVSIALIQTVALIPWIVGGIALLGGGVVVYRFIHKDKTITSTKAVAEELSQQNTQLANTATELVKTTEAAKPLMSLAGRRHLFGNGPLPGVVRSVQSEPTRKFVSKVRGEMTNVAPSIPETIASDLDVHSEPLSDETGVVEEGKTEIMSQKPDTKSVRSRRTTPAGERSTVIVLR
jgi:hypothetical protein